MYVCMYVCMYGIQGVATANLFGIALLLCGAEADPHALTLLYKKSVLN